MARVTRKNFSFPHSKRVIEQYGRMIRGIAGDPALGELMRAASGQPSPHHIPPPSGLLRQAAQAGSFKILRHPAKPAKAIFVFDARLNPLAERPGTVSPSLTKLFVFFYVLLIKSGPENFSVRMAPSGVKAAEVDENNWKKSSQLLFQNEGAEAAFINELRQSIRQP
jgi:hypothetical protein